MCKCSIMSPQNESARLHEAPGKLGYPSLVPLGAGDRNWAAGDQASLPGRGGAGRVGSGALSVFLAGLEGVGWGPEAGQVGTSRKVRRQSPQNLLYSAT